MFFMVVRVLSIFMCLPQNTLLRSRARHAALLISNTTARRRLAARWAPSRDFSQGSSALLKLYSYILFFTNLRTDASVWNAEQKLKLAHRVSFRELGGYLHLIKLALDGMGTTSNPLGDGFDAHESHQFPECNLLIVSPRFERVKAVEAKCS